MRQFWTVAHEMYYNPFHEHNEEKDNNHFDLILFKICPSNSNIILAFQITA